MEIRLSNWRQLIWPAELNWDGYEAMEPTLVPPGSAFVPKRVTADELQTWEARQIIDALGAGAEVTRELRTLGELFARLDEVYAGASDIAEWVLGSPVEWWDVHQVGVERGAAGVPDFILLLYGLDCGVIFEGQGETRVGSIAQDALWCDENPALWKALARSQAFVRREMPESRLARAALNGAVRCPTCERILEIWQTDFEDDIVCSGCGATFDAIAVMRRDPGA